MNKRDGAIFAETIYTTLRDKPDEKNIKRINKDLDKQDLGDWYVDENFYDTEVYALRNDEEKKFVIVHRGTDGGGKQKDKQKADIDADIYGVVLGYNKTEGSKTKDFFDDRTKKTENIINSTQDLGYNYYLSSHSLGGFSTLNTLETSKTTRNNVEKARTYNAGTSPLFNERRVSGRKKERLDDIVVNHRTKNDVVSQSLIVNNRYGKLKTKNTTTSKITGFMPSNLRMIFNTTDALSAHSLDNWY